MEAAAPETPNSILARVVAGIDPAQYDLIGRALAHPLWQPAPENKAQIAAVLTQADLCYYGGQAGGGKTSLLCGIAATQHRHSGLFRRYGVHLDGLVDEMTRIVGAAAFNGQRKVFEFGNKTVQLGSMRQLDDWKGYQGKARDFLGFDEAPHFLREQVMNVRGWNRSTDKGQRCRVMLAGNPPMAPEEMWIFDDFATWLDDTHANPAKPGELRWYGPAETGGEVEYPDRNGQMIRGELCEPYSKTFIPASVDNNPHLCNTSYIRTLNSLDEPLRSMLRHGKFNMLSDEHPFQVIPTAWIKAAMDRWDPAGGQEEMTGMGVDVARGGIAETAIARVHGSWLAPMVRLPGAATPDGPSAAAAVVLNHRDGCPIGVDVIGIGSSCYDHLNTGGIPVFPVNSAIPSQHMSRNGTLRFGNLRFEMWWRTREALDPASRPAIALHPDRTLLTDLSGPRWSLSARGGMMEPKELTALRIGRSPDCGDAAVMGIYASTSMQHMSRSQGVAFFNPTVISEYELLQ